LLKLFSTVNGECAELIGADQRKQIENQATTIRSLEREVKERDEHLAALQRQKRHAEQPVDAGFIVPVCDELLQ
jgi:hypothetical protein